MPVGAAYLQDIEVGEDSPKYFWLQDEYYESKDDKLNKVGTNKKSTSSSNEITFIGCSIVSVASLGIANLLNLYLGWEFIAYLFIFFAVFMFLLYIEEKFYLDKSVQIIAALSFISLFVDYFYFGNSLGIVKGIFRSIGF